MSGETSEMRRRRCHSDLGFCRSRSWNSSSHTQGVVVGKYAETLSSPAGEAFCFNVRGMNRCKSVAVEVYE